MKVVKLSAHPNAEGPYAGDQHPIVQRCRVISAGGHPVFSIEGVAAHGCRVIASSTS
jgi:hypothetical protein